MMRKKPSSSFGTGIKASQKQPEVCEGFLKEFEVNLLLNSVFVFVLNNVFVWWIIGKWTDNYCSFAVIMKNVHAVGFSGRLDLAEWLKYRAGQWALKTTIAWADNIFSSSSSPDLNWEIWTDYNVWHWKKQREINATSHKLYSTPIFWSKVFAAWYW